MRKFSELEKKVINKILDIHSKCQTNCAYNVFFDLNGGTSAPSLYGLLPGFDLRFDGIKYVLDLDSNKYNQSNFKNIFFGLITDFYEFVFLMDYLVENQYIALAQIKQSPSKPDDGYIPTDFLSEELQAKIKEYFSCYFYPTNKLYDMVEHNFLDLEEQEKKHERIVQNRQFGITTFIAIVAFIVSIASIIVPIVNEKRHENEKQKIELFISEENNTKLPVVIDNEEPISIDIDNVIHVEEDNPKKIPLDVNLNINYPNERK